MRIKSVFLFLLLALTATQLVTADNLKLRYYKKGGDFSLTDYTNKPFALKDLRGKVVILFFGYTLCPDVCPTTLLEMQKTLSILGKQAEKIKIVFVTLDPDRDKTEVLKKYLEFFDKRILGLTGKQAEVDAVAKQYAARYKRRNVGSEAGYLLDHTAFSYLIDQKGKLRYLFPFKTPPEFIVKGVRKLL